MRWEGEKTIPQGHWPRGRGVHLPQFFVSFLIAASVLFLLAPTIFKLTDGGRRQRAHPLPLIPPPPMGQFCGQIGYKSRYEIALGLDFYCVSFGCGYVWFVCACADDASERRMNVPLEVNVFVQVVVSDAIVCGVPPDPILPVSIFLLYCSRIVSPMCFAGGTHTNL